jgi:hypothetical protein
VAATLSHELIEFILVLGHAQAGKEFLELALLFLQTVQSLDAIIIESFITAR